MAFLRYLACHFPESPIPLNSGIHLNLINYRGLKITGIFLNAGVLGSLGSHDMTLHS